MTSKSNLNVKLVDDRILLRRDKRQEKTDAGLYLPDSDRSRMPAGTVVAHGAGRWSGGVQIAPLVKVGDWVLYDKTAGVPVTIDGEDYVVISENHVLIARPS